MKKYSIVITTVLLFALFIQSCKKDEASDPQADTALFALVQETGYAYYVSTPGITAAAGNSPHGFERVRFNDVAQTALDSTGKLPVGNEFPDGAVIVKEIYGSASGSLTLYAVMKKAPGSSLAASGFEWAEFNPDGSVAYSAAKKGSGCISCHSNSPNRDLVRIFDLL